MALTKISTGMLKQDAASSDLNIDAGTLYLDVSNNRVGINKTSPNQTLHVNGISQFDNTMLFGSRGRISWGSMGGGTGFGIRAASGNALSLGSNGAWDKAIIDTSGRLLINATTTAFNDKLYVNGEAYATNGWRIGTNTTFVGELTNSSGKLTLQTAANRDIQLGDTNNPDIVYVDTSTQKVGIGTTSPARQLELEGQGVLRLNATGSSTDPGIDFNTASATDMQIRYRGGTDKLAIYSYGTTSDVVTIQKSDGKVGIGTATPGEKLEVAGNVESEGLKLNVNTSMYTQNASLSYYSSTNAVYLNGPGNNGWLRLNASGTQNDGVAINLFGSNAGNLITLKTNTAERMRITPAGNVGIGGTSPTYKLVVSNGLAAGIEFGPEYATDANLIQHYDRTASQYMDVNHIAQNHRFGRGLVEHMRINSTGNVGIGTTSPETKLQISHNGGHISGTVQIAESSFDLYNPLEANTDEKGSVVTFSDNYYDGTNYIRTTRAGIKGGTDTAGNNASGFLTFFTNSGGANTLNERMRITKDGRVGIGTTSPATDLHIKNTASTQLLLESANTDTGFLLFGDAQDLNIGSVSYSHSENSMRFETDDAERMRIDSSGNVGILQSSPSSYYAKNLVVGAGSAEEGITIRGASNGRSYLMFADGTTGNQRYRGYFSYNHSIDAFEFATGGAQQAVLTSAGRLGIGTTAPAQKFHVAAGYIHVDAGYGITWDNTHERIEQSDGHLEFFVNNSEAMTLETNGLGIGITSPTAPLDVRRQDASGKIAEFHQNTGYGIDIGSSQAVAYISSGYNQRLDFKTDPTSGQTERMSILANGNVGIGTASPDARLEVEWTGTNVSTDSISRITAPIYPSLEFYSTNTNTSNRNWKIASVYNSYGTLEFLRSSAANGVPNITTLAIDNTGNVGIGTASPTNSTNLKTLDIKGTNGGQLLLGRSSQFDFFAFSSSSSTSIGTAAGQDLIIRTNSNGGNNERMRITSTGDVGIGTASPDGQLHVKGTKNKTIKLDPTFSSGTYTTLAFARNGTDKWRVFHPSDDSYLSFYNDQSGAHQLSLKSDGNVGIGTTSPETKLQISHNGGHISGTVQIAESSFDLYNPLEANTDEKGSVVTFSDNYYDGTNYIRTTRAGIKGGTDTAGNNASGFLTFFTNSGGANTLNERMRITKDGRVGIGTTSPATDLHIKNTASTQLLLESANTDTGFLLFGDAQDLNIGSVSYSHSENSMRFETDDAERMRIDSSGNVGILQSSPSSYYAKNLVVGAGSAEEGITIRGASNGRSYLMFADGTTGNQRYRGYFSYNHSIDAFEFATGGAQQAVLTSAGRLGIGTTAPAQKFHVAAGYIHVDAGYGITWDNTHERIEQSDGHLEFFVNNSEAMTLETNGLGIGITSPTAPLDVRRQDASGKIAEFHQNTGYGIDIGSSQAVAYISSGYSQRLDFKTDPSSGQTERMSILANGNVGIGTTSPQYELSFGTGYFGLNYSTGKLALFQANSTAHSTAVESIGNVEISSSITNSGAGAVKFNTFGSERMRINSSGNVGIGTASPAFRFHAYHPTTNVVSRFESGDAQVWIDLHDSNSGNYGALLGHDGSAGHLFKIADSGVNVKFLVKNDGSVGIGNTDPKAKLQVEVLGIETNQSSVTSTSQFECESFPAADFRSARYTVQITNVTDSTYHVTEILLIHDGTTPAITEFATIFTGSAAEATFDADINSGNVRLLATPASTDNMQFKVVRHSILV